MRVILVVNWLLLVKVDLDGGSVMMQLVLILLLSFLHMLACFCGLCSTHMYLDFTSQIYYA